MMYLPVSRLIIAAVVLCISAQSDIGSFGKSSDTLVSKSTNSILMILYATLYKNCSLYILVSASCFTIGLGSAEMFLVHHTVNIIDILYSAFNNVNNYVI